MSELLNELIEAIYDDKLTGTSSPMNGFPLDYDPNVHRLKTEINDEIKRLQAENERLRVVLKPFANYITEFGEDEPDDQVITPICPWPVDYDYITVGHVRAAAWALGWTVDVAREAVQDDTRVEL